MKDSAALRRHDEQIFTSSFTKFGQTVERIPICLLVIEMTVLMYTTPIVA